MVRPSVTQIVCVLFLAYILHSIYSLYQIFSPAPCQPVKSENNCIQSYMRKKPSLELYVYTSTKASSPTSVSDKHVQLVWHNASFDPSIDVQLQFNVTVPRKVRENGTYYVHVYVCGRGDRPPAAYLAYAQSPLTSYAVPKTTTFSLIGGTAGDASAAGSSKTPSKPAAPDAGAAAPKTATHWRTKLAFSVVTDLIALDRMAVPHEIYKYLRLTPDYNDYLPILYIDELSFRLKDLEIVSENATVMPLSISYSAMSLGKLRLWSQLGEAMKQLHTFGFTEKDTDEVKGIFADTNFYFLCLTFFVAAIHLLFDFLAFKNDVSYWRNRKTMVGLSSRAVVWRCVSTIIVFFYLMDEETSLLVLIPTGIGAVIEIWKVTKAFKLTITWRGWLPKVQVGTTTDQEKETEAIDAKAMKYLWYVLYPLCAAGAVYSLMYVEHRGWYSWCIQSLVNGVYAFGFLFMLPQLFLNYQLKSVAHLPWKAFMYKAFNTFIDDLFAFIITMPTAHRLACFRDDVVFLIYLYQRWLYPVDVKRVNEFGQSFGDAADEKTGEAKKKD